jgi:hypothetical protein
MRRYRPEDLFDGDGRLLPEMAALAPEGSKRMGSLPHAWRQVFDVIDRVCMERIEPYDVHLSREGRVTEVLSEHLCQGWLEGEDVWLFNVTTVLGSLDKEKLSIVYFDDGDILDIERYVFKKEIIGTAEIFKLPRRASSVYATESSSGRSVRQGYAASHSHRCGRARRRDRSHGLTDLTDGENRS